MHRGAATRKLAREKRKEENLHVVKEMMSEGAGADYDISIYEHMLKAEEEAGVPRYR